MRGVRKIITLGAWSLLVTLGTASAQDLVVSGDIGAGGDVDATRDLLAGRDVKAAERLRTGSGEVAFDAGLISPDETLTWDGFRFVFSDDLRALGALDIFGYDMKLNSDGPEGSSRLYFYEDGSSTGESLGWDDGDDRFEVSDDLLLDGVLVVERNGFGSITLDSSNPTIGVSGDLDVEVHGAVIQFHTDIDADVTQDQVAEWFNNGSVKLLDFNAAGALEISGSLTENVSFDLAEAFFAPTPLEPGEVVAVEPGSPLTVRPATEADGPRVLGVVSTEPGFVLGGPGFTPGELEEKWGAEVAALWRLLRPSLLAEVDDESLAGLEAEISARQADLETPGFPTEADRQRAQDRLTEQQAELTRRRQEAALSRFGARHLPPIALAGRVPVLASAGRGPIEPGDFLVAGPAPGIAVRAEGAGLVIGTALEGLDEGEGTVLVLVGRGWLDGSGPGTRSPDAASRPSSSTGPGESLASGDLSRRPHALPARRADDATDASFAAAEIPELVRVAGQGVAHYRPVSEAAGVGDVLVVDRHLPGLLRPGDQAADPAVVGVVAGDPGVLTGSRVAAIGELAPELAAALDAARAAGDLEEVHRTWQEMRRAFEAVHVPVATSGIVPAKVDASYGAIRIGDLLTVSPTRGHAMRVDDPAPGTVVGKALDTVGEGQALIDVLVMAR